MNCKTKKNKIINKAGIFALAKRIVVFSLIIGLNLFSFLPISRTLAFYNDTESSSNNIFEAGLLDLTVNSEKIDDNFQTYTQGGWGSSPYGNNPGKYRDDNFVGAFPSGAAIGDANGFTASFTTSAAVEIFLPAGGTPKPFVQNYTNPISTEAGVLAGQILALTLNVGFDLYDVNFAPSADNLRDFKVNELSSVCYGMTVQEVLNEGNAILGGLPSGFSPSELNGCASWINGYFDSGNDGGLRPGSSVFQNAVVLNNGGMDFQYRVSVEKTGGSDDFCNALNLQALLEGATHYTGNLMSFISLPVPYSASADEWEFIISLPEGSNVEGGCDFDFIFSGWQTNLPDFGGFNDTETISDVIYTEQESKHLVINKVYYNVDAGHNAGNGVNEWKYEWMELYNGTNEAINLNNWKVCDNDNCKTIGANVSVPALGYVLLSQDAGAWQYWEIPAGVEKINLGSALPHLELNESADMLVLKDISGVVVDQMNWGAPDSDWPNYNSDLWNPGILPAGDGDMTGRQPSGFDTDAVSDWKNLGLPETTMVYPVGGEIWYVGHTYNIQWTATNSNGSDADLSISLYYSKNSGATWAAIATNIENDGSYNWHVPLFIEPGHYYVPSARSRIKVVATGSENFMVQSSASSEDFCPPIDYDLLNLEDRQLVDQLVKDGVIDPSEVIKGGIEGMEQSPEIIEDKDAVAEEQTTGGITEAIPQLPIELPNDLPIENIIENNREMTTTENTPVTEPQSDIRPNNDLSAENTAPSGGVNGTGDDGSVNNSSDDNSSGGNGGNDESGDSNVANNVDNEAAGADDVEAGAIISNTEPVLNNNDVNSPNLENGNGDDIVPDVVPVSNNADYSNSESGMAIGGVPDVVPVFDGIGSSNLADNSSAVNVETESPTGNQ